MPYTYEWLDRDHGILQWKMEGDVNWGAFHESVNEVCDEIDAASRHVYLIILDTTGMPDGNALPHIKTSLTKYGSRENLDGIVVVANRNISLFVKSMTSVVKTVADLNIKIEFTESVDEAFDFIAKQRLSHQP